MGNTFGKLFQVTTFGESHGPGVGVIIDGMPGNFPVDLSDVQAELDRRRPGQSDLTTSRQELDKVSCLSGLENGRTLGGPITLYVPNSDMRPQDYKDVNSAFRPGHADFTMFLKYGITAKSGGGRASARETIGRVAAGAVARQLINSFNSEIEIVAWVNSVKDISVKASLDDSVSRAMVEQSEVRCPDQIVSSRMAELIRSTKASGDSVGGVIRCVIRGLPVGLGEPVFDKLEADLAKAMLSLPASKGFEIGSGFAGTLLNGSQNNDQMFSKNGQVRTKTNHAGGVSGGISNGEIIGINIAFKPVSTIFKNQSTVDREGNEITFKPESGRHDPCVLPRAVPMVEAMASLVIADHLLRWKAHSPFIES
jgi:chorismate synthase